MNVTFLKHQAYYSKPSIPGENMSEYKFWYETPFPEPTEDTSQLDTSPPPSYQPNLLQLLEKPETPSNK